MFWLKALGVPMPLAYITPTLKTASSRREALNSCSAFFRSALTLLHAGNTITVILILQGVFHESNY